MWSLVNGIVLLEMLFRVCVVDGLEVSPSFGWELKAIGQGDRKFACGFLVYLSGLLSGFVILSCGSGAR